MVEADPVYVAGQSPHRLVERYLSQMNIESTTQRSTRPRFPWLALLAILLGMWWRFATLGDESIWLDEATSILLARLDPVDLIRTTAQDIHPPLYYLALHGWLALGESEFAVRAFSALIGVLTIAGLYQLGRQLFSPQAGLLAAALLAISPLHIWYSQETRMYALVTLLTLLGSYGLWRALYGPHGVAPKATRRPHWWALFVLGMTAALYTHYHAVFMLLFQGAFVLVSAIRGAISGRALRRSALAALAIGLLFAPWLPVLLRQMATGGGLWISEAIGHPTLRALIATWIDYNLGSLRSLYPIWLRRTAYGLLLLPLIAYGVSAIREWRRGHRADTTQAYLFAALYAALTLGAVWLVSQIKPMYARRYLLLFLPGYLLVLAQGIASLPTKPLRHVAAITILSVSMYGAQLAAQTPQKDDWRSLVAHVQAHAQPGDVVLFHPLWNHKPFDYYADDALPLYIELPVPVPEHGDLEALLKPITSRYDRVWLIWRQGHYADPDGQVARYLESNYRQVEQLMFPEIDTLALFDLDNGEAATDER